VVFVIPTPGHYFGQMFGPLVFVPRSHLRVSLGLWRDNPRRTKVPDRTSNWEDFCGLVAPYFAATGSPLTHEALRMTGFCNGMVLAVSLHRDGALAQLNYSFNM
jgi:hypothetical protein